MPNADWGQLGIGALLGISAVPHCVVMCTGVATALGLAFGSAQPTQLAMATVVSNTGRISSYVLAGGAVGGMGMVAFSWLDASLANITLRWLAAILLSVVGLSLAGIMPSIFVKYPSRLVAWLASTKRCPHSYAKTLSSLFVAGAVWGFLPCAMAYSALFYATISGSAANGALTMAGFGFATLIPMALPAAGVTYFADRAVNARLKVVAGFVLALIGVAGAFNAIHDFGVWCRTS